MDWADKEASYSRRWSKGTQCRCPEKYIPMRLIKAGAVGLVCVDADGYWIYLTEGWTAYDGGEDCGVIHDYLITDLKESIRSIRRK